MDAWTSTVTSAADQRVGVVVRHQQGGDGLAGAVLPLLAALR
jgi:hypothetical protein